MCGQIITNSATSILEIRDKIKDRPPLTDDDMAVNLAGLMETATDSPPRPALVHGSCVLASRRKEVLHLTARALAE